MPGLPETGKLRLGVIVSWKSGPHLLSYRQTERTFGLLVKALSKDHPDGRPSRILAEITDALTEASVQVAGAPDTGSHAIDWTGCESFGRPPRKSRAAAQEDAAAQQSAASGKAQMRGTEKDDTADRYPSGADQQPQGACADPEAAWGHRRVNHPSKSEMFFGYHLQAATIVEQEHGPQIPELVLYCPSTPKALFELGPPAPGATEEELAIHDDKTAELACCRQQTITIPPSVTAKTAQKHDYPSKAHRHSCARRTAVERTFSRLHDPASTEISRGWSRLMGLARNALMLACAAIIANIATADAFAAHRAEDRRRAEHGLPPRRRARRRRRRGEGLHELTANANAPPAT